MAIVFPDAAEYQWMYRAIEYHASNFQLRLFQNNHTPSSSTTINSFVDCNFDGYQYQTPVWNSPTIADGKGIITTNGSIVFEAGSLMGDPQNVYGWYLEDSGGILACERFPDAPIVLSVPTDKITISSITLRLFDPLT